MVRVRIVIDTNTLIPSIFSETHLYNYIVSGNIVPLWNNFTKKEAHSIVDRFGAVYSAKGLYDNKMIYHIHLACEKILVQANYVPEMPESWPPQCRDRKDDPFLWVAFVGNAEFLITQDRKHLLRIKSFRGIPIGTPAQFFTWAKKNRPIA